ncbi:MAG: hypothetical protein QOD53_1103 [Thermoleophilaceae bacterium]|jgi:hypothetical protein|nr:hypothetical protein [Thermoleophilaceae bacterium]
MPGPDDTSQTAERCTWCGVAVERGDGYRLAESPGQRGAVFCRLEHLVPWAMQGARWQAGAPLEPGGLADSIDTCARCGDPLGDVTLTLVRHRGEHRIPDGFCSVDHLREWAHAGGRYG